jgi:hypothetical protein
MVGAEETSMREAERSRLAVACLAMVTVTVGCSRKPGSSTIIIAIDRDGLITVEGETTPPGDLSALLTQRAADTPHESGRPPVLSVSISADPECLYRHVQDAMIQCTRAYVAHISWEMDGRSIIPPEIAYKRPPVIDDTSDDSPEVRLRIRWENAEGEAIHGPTQAYADDSVGEGPALSTGGARVVIRVNQRECADLKSISKLLSELRERVPRIGVMIAPRPNVPFRKVFGAVETCRAADLSTLYIEPPPEPAIDDDWWWM